MRDIKNRKRWVSTGYLALVAVLVGVLVLTACAGGNGEPPEETKSITVVLSGSWENPGAMDPYQAYGAPFMTYDCSLWEGLCRRDVQTGEIVPCLATSWEIDPNWSYIDFFLQEDITFHNGDPMTAEDVKFTFERAMHPGFVVGTPMLMFVDSVNIINDYHVRVDCIMPFWDILDICSAVLPIVPKDYIEKEGDDGFAQNPVGTGPFKIISWEYENYVRMEAVEDHWRQAPNYDELEIKTISDITLALLETGEADVTWVMAADLSIAEANPDITVGMNEQVWLETLVFHDLRQPVLEGSPWPDARVRQAASRAINRPDICTEVTFDTRIPWGNFLAEYHPGFEARTPDPYDPDEAINLLCDVAGVSYPPGDRPYPWESWAWGDFTGFVTADAVYDAMLADLHSVGIMVNPVGLEAGTWSTKFTQGQLRGISTAPGPYWVGLTSPILALLPHTLDAWGPCYRTYPQVQIAFLNMVYTTTDEERAQETREFEDLLFTLGCRVPLWYLNVYYGYRNDTVQSYQSSPNQVAIRDFEYLVYKE